MKRTFLVGELSDWINILDDSILHTTTLTSGKAQELQELLIHLRKELLDLSNELANHKPEDSKKEMQAQVQAEIQKQLTKFKYQRIKHE